MRPTKTVDEIKIQRGLLTAFLLIVCVFSAWFGLSRGMSFVGLIIPFVALVSWLFGQPGYLLIFALFAESAQFVIPGVTKTMGGFQIFQALTIGWAILDVCLHRGIKLDSTLKRRGYWMGAFAINLILIQFVRGSGFRMAGSSTYGGTGYILLYLALGFYFSAIRINLTHRMVKVLLYSGFIAVLIPALTEVLANFTGGFSWLTSFVNTNIDQILYEGEAEGGIQRWSSVASVGAALIPLAFVFCRKAPVRWLLYLTGIAIVTLSGFRGRTLAASIIVFALTMYDSKDRKRTFVLWLLIGLAGLGFLMIAAPMLPRAVQRAISFVEFIPVDPDIARRAHGSSTWRFDLWKDYCIPNVPKYLLIGRGIAHDITQFAWLQSSWYGSADFYYYMGRYHSGPFSLLLDCGLAGLICFTTFFLLSMKEGWRTTRQSKSEENNRYAVRYYAYLCFLLTYRVFGFYLLFGDVRESVPKLLVTVVQMVVVRRVFFQSRSPAAFVKAGEAGELPGEVTAAGRGRKTGGGTQRPVLAETGSVGLSRQSAT